MEFSIGDEFEAARYNGTRASYRVICIARNTIEYEFTYLNTWYTDIAKRDHFESAVRRGIITRTFKAFPEVQIEPELVGVI